MEIRIFVFKLEKNLIVQGISKMAMSPDWNSRLFYSLQEFNMIHEDRKKERERKLIRCFKKLAIASLNNRFMVSIFQNRVFAYIDISGPSPTSKSGGCGGSCSGGWFGWKQELVPS